MYFCQDNNNHYCIVNWWHTIDIEFLSTIKQKRTLSHFCMFLFFITKTKCQNILIFLSFNESGIIYVFAGKIGLEYHPIYALKTAPGRGRSGVISLFAENDNLESLLIYALSIVQIAHAA